MPSAGVHHETADGASDVVGGAFVSDYDREGDQDGLVTEVTGRIKMYEDTRGEGDSLIVDIRPDNKAPALAAVVGVVTIEGAIHMKTDTAGVNFLSQNQRTQHVGLDGAAVERVGVVWLDGQKVVFEGVRVDQQIKARFNGILKRMI